MEYHPLGHAPFRVPELGFGLWELSGSYGGVDEADVTRAVHRALELGVTLFDTAPAYGNGRSEQVLGRALRGRRAEALVVTKGGVHDAPGGGWYADSRPAGLLRGIEESLRHLQMDYVDLFLIHWPDPHLPAAAAMEGLHAILASGKARAVGVSNFRAHQLRAAAAQAPLAANQVGYNLFDRRWEREMFPAAQELGVGIMAYGPLAHGLLTGAFGPETTFGANDWRASGDAFGQALFTPEHFARNLRVVEGLKGVTHDLGTTLPRLALAWVLSNPRVGVALCGMRSMSELEDNVRALDVRLSDAVLGEIDRIMAGAAGLSDQVPLPPTQLPPDLEATEG